MGTEKRACARTLEKSRDFHQAEAEDATVEVDTAPTVVRDRCHMMNAESFPFMRFFEPLVRISSSRRVDPSDRRTDAW